MQAAVHLEGDVITANGSILSGYVGHLHEIQAISMAPVMSDSSSFTTCNCACFKAKNDGKSKFL